MERDIALVVNKGYLSSDVLNIMMKAGKPLLENAVLIDKYEGENIQDGSISYTYRLTYRNPNETLKEEDIAPVHESIKKALISKAKAELRI